MLALAEALGAELLDDVDGPAEVVSPLPQAATVSSSAAASGT